MIIPARQSVKDSDSGSKEAHRPVIAAVGELGEGLALQGQRTSEGSFEGLSGNGDVW